MYVIATPAEWAVINTQMDFRAWKQWGDIPEWKLAEWRFWACRCAI